MYLHGGKSYEQMIYASYSPRSKRILMIINIVMFIFGCCNAGLGAYVEYLTSIGNSGIGFTILGVCIVVLSLFGYIGAKTERNWMLQIYFYGAIVMIALLVLFSISALFFQDVFRGWVKHNWDTPSLALLRKQGCCDTAQDTTKFLKFNFMALGILGFTLVGLLLIALQCTLKIVTLPIIMRNLVTTINVVFIAMGAGLIVVGLQLNLHEEMEMGHEWIGISFVVFGAIIVFLSLIGICGAKAKKKSALMAYIIGVIICFIVVVAVGVFSLIFTEILAEKYENRHHGDIACAAKLKLCTNCTNVVPCIGITKSTNDHWEACTMNSSSCVHGKTLLAYGQNNTWDDMQQEIADCAKCPEWSEEDVDAYVSTSVKFLGLLLSIICIFLFVGCTGAIVLRRSLVGYQTESI